MDKNNSFIDATPPTIWFYYKEAYLNQKPQSNILSNNYIKINSKKVYITSTSTNGIFFTIPESINGKSWDFHYHFGISNIINPASGNHLIYFHKTIQNPIINGKVRQNCFFEDKQNITKVSDLRCLQTKSKIMEDIFMSIGEDISFIEELISRPFLGVRKGGKKGGKKKYKETSKN